MLKLMKLELKKYKIGGTIRGAVITTTIISLFFLFAMFITVKTGDKSFFENYNEMIKIFVRGVYTIFAAVLISHYIIDEYSNKTINIMFMYPIKRKNIMIAKLIIIVVFIFTAMIISNIFIHGFLYVANIFGKCIDINLMKVIGFNNLIDIVIDSALYSLLSLLPVYVGMKKKTTASVILTSIIMTSLLNSGSADFTLGSLIIITCILAVIGVLVAYMSIKNVEKDDVVN